MLASENCLAAGDVKIKMYFGQNNHQECCFFFFFFCGEYVFFWHLFSQQPESQDLTVFLCLDLPHPVKKMFLFQKSPDDVC